MHDIARQKIQDLIKALDKQGQQYCKPKYGLPEQNWHDFEKAKLEVIQYFAELTPERMMLDQPGGLKPGVQADWGAFYNALCWKMRPMNWGGKMFYTIIERISHDERSKAILDPSERLTMTLRMWPVVDDDQTAVEMPTIAPASKPLSLEDRALDVEVV